jgi:hypothetical protein
MMIQKYEGFLSNLFKKKPEPVKINHDDIIELSNDCFIELKDRGYQVRTKYDLNNELYTQITKDVTLRGRGSEVPYNFIDIKDDVLSFYDRLKDYGVVNINFAFVYENDKDFGLSCDHPQYEEFEKGDYDNREVSILTITFK